MKSEETIEDFIKRGGEVVTVPTKKVDEKERLYKGAAKHLNRYEFNTHELMKKREKRYNIFKKVSEENVEKAQIYALELEKYTSVELNALALILIETKAISAKYSSGVRACVLMFKHTGKIRGGDKMLLIKTLVVNKYYTPFEDRVGL